jgi:K+-transporting ATPase ATPase A chain
MEGKELRFGTAASALFVTVTTDASCGAVNSMHDSLMPLGGLIPIFNMQLSEVVVGGVGSGFYGMLIYAIISVFIAGLMVGRTPEYIGKKIESYEMKLLVIGIAILPLVMLTLAAIACIIPAGLAGPAAKGAHGFSEILYAYTSSVANNGSAFAGLSGNTPFYNGTLALAMFLSRFGTFPTTGVLWVGLVIAVIVIVGGLTFLPALVLGPIADHFQLAAGTLL